MRLTSGRSRACLVSILVACAALTAREARAQLFGLEASNTLMPASGGMAGTSIAEPQDLTSAINGNPATLTQFGGTQFLFGLTWAEPTFNLTQTREISGIVDPFSAKSSGPGFPAGNLGVTQDTSALGLPATVGLGFITTTGGAFDFRQVPEADGTNSALTIVNVPAAIGVDVTERLAVGSAISLGLGIFDPPFFGAMTIAYGLRGSVGADYRLTDRTTLGVYYETEQAFRFSNAVVIDDPVFSGIFDVNLDMPQNIGFGIANRSLAGGRLLLALDVLYLLWNRAAMFENFYDNQWVVQVGAQYSSGRYRLRAGYAWAQNPLDPSPDLVIAGIVLPGDLPFVRFNQALLAVTSQHRLTGGIGVRDLLPGLDLDLMAGGMFFDRQQLGEFTSTSILSYWVGGGLTWRFGRGSCERLPVPNHW